MAKFHSTWETIPEDFVKNHFKGAIMDIDMDEVYPYLAYNTLSLGESQGDLAQERKEIEDQSDCMCTKLLVTEPYKFKFNK